MRKHLVWFETPKENKEKYFNYWKNHIEELEQKEGSEIKRYLSNLEEKKLK
ncbi:MAG: hypothetical protein BTN85_0830 [Candidatus Methanohalarchaeum thermophilum]|uniref:Uncharacterized protein n=1 Tax=Methanohalarchaeum thermophilum TaxID=1903181 RepID=A0A1Q6DVD2_METT1|nr:MAG: hypothetical protein BTN85_0830 [Candidatus Methanohalarchaeum thermophilum]